MRVSAKVVSAAVCMMALLAPAAAQDDRSQPAAPQPPAEQMKQPDHIQVQHVLIGFAGSARPTKAQRTAEEAKKLAYEVLERAKKGEDFDALVKQYTDDSPPGIYAMANNGVAVKPPPPREFPRAGMVAAFGNVGFALQVGEIGIADHDPQTSPFGYHIIKRIQ